MSKAVTSLMLLATAGLLASCGTGARGAAAETRLDAIASTAHDATVSSASVGASGRLTKQQASAFAHAVNLRSADVPGFKMSSEPGEHETRSEKRLEGELLTCVAGGVRERGRDVAEVESAAFEREGSSEDENVQSGVTVERTAAVAAKELAAIRGRRGRHCLSRYVNLLFKRQKPRGMRVSRISISSRSLPAPGTAGSFGLRIAATITERGVRVPFYIDMLGFVYGPAEVSLLAVGLPEPFPAATEQRLFSLLLARARSYHL